MDRDNLPPDTFRREYLGIFIEDEHETLLREIAQTYFARCDTYDQEVCHNEQGYPMDGWELALINRHARTVIEELSQQYHIETDTVFKAIQHYSK
jgi:hypothetical protein